MPTTRATTAVTLVVTISPSRLGGCAVMRANGKAMTERFGSARRGTGNVTCMDASND